MKTHPCINCTSGMIRVVLSLVQDFLKGKFMLSFWTDSQHHLDQNSTYGNNTHLRVAYSEPFQYIVKHKITVA